MIWVKQACEQDSAIKLFYFKIADYLPVIGQSWEFILLLVQSSQLKLELLSLYLYL